MIPLEPGLCPTSQRIVFLRVSNGLLLVVSSSHLEFWSSSQVPLAPPFPIPNSFFVLLQPYDAEIALNCLIFLGDRA